MKILVTVTMLFSFLAAAAQVEFEVEISQQDLKKAQTESKYDIIFNQFQLDVDPIAFGIPLIAFQINPCYRLNDRLWLDGRFRTPYSKGVANTAGFTDIPKSQLIQDIDFNPMIHFEAFSTSSNSKLRIYEINFGFLYNKSNTKGYLVDSLPSPNGSNLPSEYSSSYQLTHVSSSSIMLGLNYRVTSNQNTYHNNGNHQVLYLNLCYSINSQYQVNKTIYGSNTNPNAVVEAVPGEYVPLKELPIGYRIGYKYIFGFDDPDWGLMLGVEQGTNPSHYIENSSQGSSFSEYISFNIGVQLGRVLNK